MNNFKKEEANERDDRQLERNHQNFKPYLMSALFIATSRCCFLRRRSQAADRRPDYPDREIEYVVHSSPGGNNDRSPELVSDIFQKEKIFGQPLV
jgi:tripartite-type tricarboxylate transporter receptor subunit TctC